MMPGVFQRVGGFLVAGLLLAAASVPAQEPPPYVVVLTSQVKADMLQEYEDLIRHEINPALAKGGMPWKSTWRTAMFGDAYRYLNVWPLQSFSQLDGAGPLDEALGAEGTARLMSKIRKCVHSTQISVLQTRPDLGVQAQEGMEMALFVTIDVQPGKAMDFAAMVRDKMLPVVKKSGSKGWLVSQLVFGGNTNQFAVVSAVDDWAAFDEPNPFVKVLGPEKAQEMMTEVSSMVDRVEMSVIEYAPELSFDSGATSQASGN